MNPFELAKIQLSQQPQAIVNDYPPSFPEKLNAAVRIIKDAHMEIRDFNITFRRKDDADLVQIPPITDSSADSSREGPPYPNGWGRVKCVYCSKLLDIVCQVIKEPMDGISLLRDCDHFVMMDPCFIEKGLYRIIFPQNEESIIGKAVASGKVREIEAAVEKQVEVLRKAETAGEADAALSNILEGMEYWKKVIKRTAGMA